VSESEVTSAFDLVGTVSVVTGGGSGIGLGIAAGLARAGSSIALIGRSAERLAQASTTLSRFGTRVIAISADVSDETAMRDAMALVREELGRIDEYGGAVGEQRHATSAGRGDSDRLRPSIHVKLTAVEPSRIPRPYRLRPRCHTRVCATPLGRGSESCVLVDRSFEVDSSRACVCIDAAVERFSV
jgi:short chain dehydrogenase